LLGRAPSVLAQITTALLPIAQLPSFLPMDGGETEHSAAIERSRLVAQGIVRGGRDGAFELTLVWVAAVAGAWASRLGGRLVATRKKRPRTS
jgi:hypothetical protein